MYINYKDNKVRKQCTNLTTAKKDFSEKVARKLHMLINFIEAAENLNSIISISKYNFHALKGGREGQYALDIDGRRSSYRLIITFDSVSKEDVFTNRISIEEIKIEEVSNHYG